MKDHTTRKTQLAHIRLTIAEHNTLTRYAVNNGKSISDAMRTLINFDALIHKETGNAAVQPVSGK